MNGYAGRAPFYRSEFAVRDDLSLLERLLAGEDGLAAFEDRFGAVGLDLLWAEVSGWVRSPEKFFRNYSVRYLEYVFGQLSGSQPAAVALSS